MQCRVFISRLFGGAENDGKVVRIEARDGAKLLSRIDLSVEDFALAVMGLGGVRAEHSTVRTPGTPRAAPPTPPREAR